MSLKLVSFSDYLLDISIIKKENIDFFSFLILEIIDDNKIDDNLLFKKIINDLNFPIQLNYIFENVFLNLLDKNLVKSSSEDFLNITKKEVILTSLGKKCLENKFIPLIGELIEKRIIINQVEKSFIIENNFKNSDSNFFIQSKNFDLDELTLFLNSEKEKIFPLINSDEFIELTIKEVNPVLLNIPFSYDKKNISIDNNYFESLNLEVEDILELNEINNNIEFNKNSILLTKNHYYPLIISSNKTVLNNFNSKFKIYLTDQNSFSIDTNYLTIPINVFKLEEEKNYIYSNELIDVSFRKTKINSLISIYFMNHYKDKAFKNNLLKYLENLKVNNDELKIINEIINIIRGKNELV